MNTSSIRNFATTLCLSLAFSAQGQSPSSKQLLKISEGTYRAFQNRDNKAMRALTTPDFTYVGTEGILSGPALSEATKGCVLKTFALSNEKIKTIEANTATLTYISHQDEVCDGRAMPSTLVNLDVFLRRNGTWLVITHVEIAEK